MRIVLFSDIHLSVNALPFPRVDADIVVLVGDISRPATAIEWARSCHIPLFEERIKHWQPVLWLHGQTHSSFDYRVGKTRVICNARGYAKDGVNENPGFDISMLIDLDICASESVAV